MLMGCSRCRMALCSSAASSKSCIWCRGEGGERNQCCARGQLGGGDPA